MTKRDSRLLLLNEADNVFVLRGRVAAGERVALEAGVGAPLPRDLPLAHKIARRPIAEGQRIIKYGAPIGVATADIAAGQHVHVHNVRSDYTPTYTLEAEKAPEERITP
jgi:altronate dehydratase small subunit